MQIRLFSLARNFGDRMHDSPCSRARCFSSMQCVLTAQSRGALPGAMVPVGASASRRPPQIHSPCSGCTDTIYGSEPDLWKLGFGCGCGLLPSGAQTGTTGSGTIPATVSSSRAYPRSLPVRSSLLHSRKSAHQNRLVLPQGGRAHRVCRQHVPGRCRQLTGSPFTF